MTTVVYLYERVELVTDRKSVIRDSHGAIKEFFVDNGCWTVVIDGDTWHAKERPSSNGKIELPLFEIEVPDDIGSYSEVIAWAAAERKKAPAPHSDQG